MLNIFIYSSPKCTPLAAQFGKVQNISRKLFENGNANIKVDIQPILQCKYQAFVVYFFHYSTLGEKKMEEIILHMLTETNNIERLLVVELFDSTATSERITEEGEIATANIDAHFWKTLPLLASGRKVHRLIYDHHTLQNRIYLFGGNVQPIMCSAVPLFIRTVNPKAIAFPDDGAAKRFSPFFAGTVHPEDIIICKKIRGSGENADKRVVSISDGDPTGKDLFIVDDLVRSGNTLLECAIKLKQSGAASISFFVTHAEFPCDEWHKFIDNPLVSKFFTTDSCPKAYNLPSPFVVLSLKSEIEDHIRKSFAQ